MPRTSASARAGSAGAACGRAGGCTTAKAGEVSCLPCHGFAAESLLDNTFFSSNNFIVSKHCISVFLFYFFFRMHSNVLLYHSQDFK